jgi:hypothetical protein
MLVLTRSIPVNPALSREQAFAALVRLADDPTCAPPCSCAVLERGAEALVREVDSPLGGRARERVSFLPPDRVRVLRLTGPARGATEQRLDTGAGGRLVVKVTSAIEVEGQDERAGAEAVFGAELKALAAALG